jgi:hypothetical protein
MFSLGVVFWHMGSYYFFYFEMHLRYVLNIKKFETKKYVCTSSRATRPQSCFMKIRLVLWHVKKDKKNGAKNKACHNIVFLFFYIDHKKYRLFWNLTNAHISWGCTCKIFLKIFHTSKYIFLVERAYTLGS